MLNKASKQLFIKVVFNWSVLVVFNDGIIEIHVRVSVFLPAAGYFNHGRALREINKLNFI